MPNWCENELMVTGDQKQIDEFIEKAKSENGALDFNSFIPYPEEFEKKDKEAREYEKANPTDWKNRPKDGYNQGGYEWCINNWGTKWNACEVRLQREKEWRVNIDFETAWSPPVPVVLAMSKAFPELNFEMQYFEGGCAFQGTFIAKAGEVICDKTTKYSGSRGG